MTTPTLPEPVTTKEGFLALLNEHVPAEIVEVAFTIFIDDTEALPAVLHPYVYEFRALMLQSLVRFDPPTDSPEGMELAEINNTVEALTDSVRAHREAFDQEKLELVIDALQACLARARNVYVWLGR